jgi:prepilin peptidase CpaA
MQLLLLVTCLWVVASDLIARRVPNLLLFVVLIAQCIFIGLGRAGIPWMDSLLGLCLGLFGMLPFYVLRLMGAGDVKFAALLGVFVGPVPLFEVWVMASLLAGVHSLTYFAIRASDALTLVGARCAQTGWYRRMESLREGRRGIPFAAYLAFCMILLLALSKPGTLGLPL